MASANVKIRHVFADTFLPENRVVAKGDAREVGDRELELFQICQSTSLPGLSVNFFR